MVKRNVKTKLLGLLFITAICISVLTGCGSFKEIISNMEGSPSDAQEDSQDLKDRSEFLASHMVEGRDDLFDLSEYAKDGDAEIYYFGFRTDDELMLIYKNISDKGEDYYVKGLDIMTGETKDYPWTWTEEKNEYDYVPYVELVSINPLVLYCSEKGTIITPESDPAELKIDPEKYSGVTVVDGTYYLIGTGNNLDKLSPDGKIENIYTAPDSLEWIYLERPEEENIIKLSATERDGEYLFIDYDPIGRGVRYYTQDRENANVVGTKDGWQYKIEYKEDDVPDTIALTNVRSGQSRKIKLDEKIQGHGYIDLTQGALSDNGLLFGVAEFESNPHEIFIWDYSKTDLEKTKINAKVPYEIKKISVYDLREKADEIDEKYGVTIKYGDDIRTYTAGYRFKTYNNKGAIMQAMNVLDESFSIYPEGFFETLEEKFEEPICFTLTGTQIPRSKKDSISSSAGLQSNEDGAIVIYLDIDTSYLTRTTVVHEISHVIDQRLIVDGFMDEDTWSSLNPPDFDYYYTYVSDEGEDYSWGDSEDSNKYTTMYENAWQENYKDSYYIDSYAKTFPTEDRARLFEYLIGSDDDYYDDCFKSEHIQEKLEYYFKALREDLATDSWPEETVWEKKLKHYQGE
ncbi:MAG: hypothetical protein J5517_00210 [Eubacterium sp.]|nr:hypothetical protein [Eubacterium sp.]